MISNSLVADFCEFAAGYGISYDVQNVADVRHCGVFPTSELWRREVVEVAGSDLTTCLDTPECASNPHIRVVFFRQIVVSSKSNKGCLRFLWAELERQSQ